METAKLVCCFLFDLIFFNKNIKKFNTSQDWLLPPKPVVYKETMKAAGAHTEIRGAEKWIKNTVEITWGGNQLRVPSVVSIRPDSFEITDPIYLTSICDWSAFTRFIVFIYPQSLYVGFYSRRKIHYDERCTQLDLPLRCETRKKTSKTVTLVTCYLTRPETTDE